MSPLLGNFNTPDVATATTITAALAPGGFSANVGTAVTVVALDTSAEL